MSTGESLLLLACLVSLFVIAARHACRPNEWDRIGEALSQRELAHLVLWEREHRAWLAQQRRDHVYDVEREGL